MRGDGRWAKPVPGPRIACSVPTARPIWKSRPHGSNGVLRLELPRLWRPVPCVAQGIATGNGRSPDEVAPLSACSDRRSGRAALAGHGASDPRASLLVGHRRRCSAAACPRRIHSGPSRLAVQRGRWLADMVRTLGGIWFASETHDPDSDLGPVLARVDAPLLFTSIDTVARRLGCRAAGAGPLDLPALLRCGRLGPVAGLASSACRSCAC